MGRLIYTAIGSLDGYIADRDGNFDWSMPDEQVHAFVNDRTRSIGTFLVGRRLYDVMAVWDTFELAGMPPEMVDFAQLWRAADKVVYSRTLDEPSAPRTRLARSFDVDEVRRLKETSERDLAIGGAELAAEAFRAGLVDEVELFLSPVVIGGGTAALPVDLRIDLELLDQRRFDNGVVHLRYRLSQLSP